MSSISDSDRPHTSPPRVKDCNGHRSSSANSVVSVSIGESAIRSKSMSPIQKTKYRPTLGRSMRSFQKRSVTIYEGTTASDLSSHEIYDNHGSSHEPDMENVIEECTVAQMTLMSIEDSVKYIVSHWKILLFGQLISFLSASAGAAQATLGHKCGLNSPAFSNALMYLVLSFLLVPLSFQRHRETTADHRNPPMYTLLGVPIYSPAWMFAGSSILHFLANYCVVYSFRYTTFTSIMLLDVLALPSAMILSRLFLSRCYVSIHYLGASVCVLGILFNTLADYELRTTNKGLLFPNLILGDTLAGIGAILYGTNNVIAESLVRGEGGPIEYLGCLGFFGLIWSLLQAVATERDDIAMLFDGSSSCSLTGGGLLMFLFVKTKALTFFCSAHFLVISESALLNISILTSDVWAVAFSVIAQHILPSPLFWVAISFTCSGVLIYEIAPSPIFSKQSHRRRYPYVLQCLPENSPRSRADMRDEFAASMSSGESIWQSFKGEQGDINS